MKTKQTCLAVCNNIKRDDALMQNNVLKAVISCRSDLLIHRTVFGEGNKKQNNFYSSSSSDETRALNNTTVRRTR